MRDMELDFGGGHGSVILVAVELAQAANGLHRVLARSVWESQPVVSVLFDAARDRVALRVVNAPTVAEMVTDEAAFVGFDAADAGGWPTVVTVLDANRELSGLPSAWSPVVQVAARAVGPSAWAAVRDLVDAGLDAQVDVPLTFGEASQLRAVWQQLLSAAIDGAAQSASASLPADGAELLPTQLTSTPASAKPQMEPEVNLADGLTNVLSDANLKKVLLEWSTTVSVALARAHTQVPGSSLRQQQRRTVPITDEEVFQQLVGRKRRRLEPWPSARVDFDPKGEDYLVSVTVFLPALSPAAPTVAAVLEIADHTWNMILEVEHEQDRALSATLIGCRLLPASALAAPPPTADDPSVDTGADSSDEVRMRLTLHTGTPGLEKENDHR